MVGAPRAVPLVMFRWRSCDAISERACSRVRQNYSQATHRRIIARFTRLALAEAHGVSSPDHDATVSCVRHWALINSDPSHSLGHGMAIADLVRAGFVSQVAISAQIWNGPDGGTRSYGNVLPQAGRSYAPPQQPLTVGYKNGPLEPGPPFRLLFPTSDTLFYR